MVVALNAFTRATRALSRGSVMDAAIFLLLKLSLQVLHLRVPESERDSINKTHKRKCETFCRVTSGGRVISSTECVLFLQKYIIKPILIRIDRLQFR